MTNWTGDYNGILVHGRNFYGTFATDNTPDLTNFPHGVRYQRNVNFATKQLLNLAGTGVIAASIDPFFFEISWPEEEEEEEREREFGFERLELEGLEYQKKLSIKRLRLERIGREDHDDERRIKRKGRAIHRLLWKVIEDIEHEHGHREEDEDDDE